MRGALARLFQKGKKLKLSAFFEEKFTETFAENSSCRLQQQPTV